MKNGLASVYIVQADNGEVKVGITGSTPDARLSKIKRDYAERRRFKDAFVVCWVDTWNPTWFEQHLIEFHVDNAVGGEWLRCSSLVMLQTFVMLAKLYGVGPICMQGPPEHHVSVRVVRGWFRRRLLTP